MSWSNLLGVIDELAEALVMQPSKILSCFFKLSVMLSFLIQSKSESNQNLAAIATYATLLVKFLRTNHEDNDMQSYIL